MAKDTEVAKEGPQFVGYDPANFADTEWETAHVEAADQVQFDTVGDTIIGVYAGHEVIWPDRDNPDPEKARKHFIQLKWTVPGGAIFVNAGYELENAFTERSVDSDGAAHYTDKIPVGTMTRVTLMKFVDVDRKDPMKSFRIDTAKLNSNANSTGS